MALSAFLQIACEAETEPNDQYQVPGPIFTLFLPAS